MSTIATATPVSAPATPSAVARALPLVFGTDGQALAAALDELDELDEPGGGQATRTLLRLGLLQPGRTTTWYQKLLGRWESLGRPPLKPNSARSTLGLLCDHTIENVTPLITAFAAPLGVHLDAVHGAYDSVELEALNSDSPLYASGAGFIAVVLSEHWLRRQLGRGADGGLVAADDLQRTIAMLRRVVSALLERSRAQVLVTSFAPPAHVPVAGYARCAGAVGWSSAVARLNVALDEMQDEHERLAVLDQAAAIHASGGSGAYSAENYLRARMPYQPAAAIALAREMAAAIASLCGKAHRAIVTDLDNTLWGGIVGDDGRGGVVTGQDSAEGLGYYQLQAHLKGLSRLGVLLAVASRNSAQVGEVLADNDDLAIDRGDFASLQISWQPKSRSIARIAAELGFGAEFMVFVDDNIFELAEALGAHPFLDVVLADPDPTRTRAAIAAARLFHSVRVTESDLARHQRCTARTSAAALEASFDDYEQYLRAIHVRVTVASLDDDNRRRVLQLLQKSNQFNLTTRRHAESDLKRLAASGATIGAFSYEDDFGSQGVIAAVVLVPEGPDVRIDTWVMSCRVLNRTVEQAIARWIVTVAGERLVIGEFIATEKNAIVEDLYERLGFHLLRREGGGALWAFDAASGDVAAAGVAELIVHETQEPMP